MTWLFYVYVLYSMSFHIKTIMVSLLVIFLLLIYFDESVFVCSHTCLCFVATISTFTVVTKTFEVYSLFNGLLLTTVFQLLLHPQSVAIMILSVFYFFSLSFTPVLLLITIFTFPVDIVFLQLSMSIIYVFFFM